MQSTGATKKPKTEYDFNHCKTLDLVDNIHKPFSGIRLTGFKVLPHHFPVV